MAAYRLLPAGGKILAAGLGLSLGYAAAPITVFADKEKKNERANLFDPEALERGAKALREINSSPYAKQVGQAPHSHQTCGSL
jgi:ATPase family AAA domain-containing protein 3A/B